MSIAIEEQQKLWQEQYRIVPEQFKKIREIEKVAAVFNTNIDAVVKISGEKLGKLAASVAFKLSDSDEETRIVKSPKDAVRGIVKCFLKGIAEEWPCYDESVYEWLKENLNYNNLQIGGQAGIIANLAAASGVKKVLVHTSSHPQLQAEQFLAADNLWAVDENGLPQKASQINRHQDKPLVHWIIEFSAGDKFSWEGQTFTCPKSNRFIITYDEDNMNLRINKDFGACLCKEGFDYLLMSGYQNLSSERGGLERIQDCAQLIGKWKKANPQGIVHLELASTQDKKIRETILAEIAPLADSIGLNEREAWDFSEVAVPGMFAKVKSPNLTAPLLFEIISVLKEYCAVSRIQLHMPGLYMTLQNEDFKITAEQNKKGMMLAATVAAAKASGIKLEKEEDFMYAHGQNVAEYGIKVLTELASYLRIPNLALTGISNTENGKLIAIPTILVKNPRTLVGMGDTISTLSLIGAR